MLSINSLTINYGEKHLFTAKLNLLANERYAVTGANGCGKSTFLRLIAGEETGSQGSVEMPKSVSIGILKQDHFSYEHDRVVDVVLKGKKDLWRALEEQEDLLTKPHISNEEGMRLIAIDEVIAHHDGYTAQALAQNILTGLGIKAKYHEGPLSNLSGGYKLRVLLAQVLFQKPDILLLDEPTNHLDILSINWLEHYLKTQYRGLLIFVSHDRQFISNLSTQILDIDYAAVTKYPGNYDEFIATKEAMVMQKEQDIASKEKKIETLQAFVDRFRAGTRSKQALSRVKMMDKIEITEMAPSSYVRPNFNFEPKVRSGKNVLRIEKIKKQFSEQVVLENITFNVQRGQRCVIIGPNGIGKSTLLKIILEKIKADSGHYEWIDTSQIGYFAQDFKGDFQKNMSVWQWLETQSDLMASTSDMRKVLGQVLFKGDDIDKKLSVLSGGEAARLVLASLMLRRPNVLVMDEPTNHLDLESIDALAQALNAYTGTLILVSHNRYFVSKVAKTTIALTERGVPDFPSDYNEYLSKYNLAD